MDKRTEEKYAAMARILVRERIFEMYAAGKTVEEIADAMSPWGIRQPSQQIGFVRGIITRAVGRGEIAANLIPE